MNADKKIKIAIDGPAASGKSTTARLLANKLDYTYIDSGAMYRAVTLKALRSKVPVTENRRVAEIAASIKLRLEKDPEKTVIFMDEEDISEAIRTPEIDRAISPVAANPMVRELLVKLQQQMGVAGGVVMDGRDIGTVVFPDAELKIYMKASAEERALRRRKELAQRGIEADLQQLTAEIRQRDRADRERSHGPLKMAADAVELDTTKLTIAEQVERIFQLALQRIQ
ncbi:MAG: (d)CMP kinase [Calditrichia bacterium]